MVTDKSFIYWFSTRCIPSNNSRVKSSVLYNDYWLWCIENGFKLRYNKNWFGRMILSKPHIKKIRACENKERFWVYEGIRLKNGDLSTL